MNAGGGERCPHGLPRETCAVCPQPPPVLELAIALERAVKTIADGLDEYRGEPWADAAEVARIEAELRDHRQLLGRCHGD